METTNTKNQMTGSIAENQWGATSIKQATPELTEYDFGGFRFFIDQDTDKCYSDIEGQNVLETKEAFASAFQNDTGEIFPDPVIASAI